VSLNVLLPNPVDDYVNFTLSDPLMMAIYNAETCVGEYKLMSIKKGVLVGTFYLCLLKNSYQRVIYDRFPVLFDAVYPMWIKTNINHPLYRIADREFS
jgi:hypothetical protein